MRYLQAILITAVLFVSAHAAASNFSFNNTNKTGPNPCSGSDEFCMNFSNNVGDYYIQQVANGYKMPVAICTSTGGPISLEGPTNKYSGLVQIDVNVCSGTKATKCTKVFNFTTTFTNGIPNPNSGTIDTSTFPSYGKCKN